MLLSRKLEMHHFIWYEQPAQMQVCVQRLSLVFQCPCYNSSMVQNFVWWKLHIVRLRIPPTEGDLRDLLWHSICAPKREIQIHLAGSSAGSVWGNPISHTGTLHPARESHLFTSELCQQNGRLNLSMQPCHVVYGSRHEGIGVFPVSCRLRPFCCLFENTRNLWRYSLQTYGWLVIR